MGPVARMPRPPALETAATIFGTLIQLIPERKMGYLIPNSSVILVFIYLLRKIGGQRPYFILINMPGTLLFQISRKHTEPSRTLIYIPSHSWSSRFAEIKKGEQKTYLLSHKDWKESRDGPPPFCHSRNDSERESGSNCMKNHIPIEASGDDKQFCNYLK
jgi:hypothetical protein